MVSATGNLSPSRTVTRGVHQGLIIGPLLYLIMGATTEEARCNLYLNEYWNPTTSFLIAAALIYAAGAGITAGAGTSPNRCTLPQILFIDFVQERYLLIERNKEAALVYKTNLNYISTNKNRTENYKVVC